MTGVQTCALPICIKLNSNGFTRTNHEFQGYGTGTTSVTHNAGTSYSFSNNTTLYAIWKRKGDSFLDKVTSLPENLVVDSDGNSRYTGSNANNYVSFNNELWQIIGVFDGKTKIIKDGYIGNKVWDSGGKNDWATSSLYSYLNTTYYNELNVSYRNMVENATWRTGGWNTPAVTTPLMYSYEGSIKGGSSSSTIATGYIGLMSASDYGYASSGCYSEQNLNLYNKCTSTTWLTKGEGGGSIAYEWMLTPSTSDTASVFYIVRNVNVTTYGTVSLLPIATTTSSMGVRPALYLKSSVYITGGTGTRSDPFILGM